MNGITSYVSTHGARVARLHYSAHPKFDLDTPEGVEAIQKVARKYGGMDSPKFRREMEIDFNVRGSSRVWPHFLEKIQPAVVVQPFDVPPHWPVKAGYDYGHTNPFAFEAVAYESETSFYVFDELYLEGKDVFEQARLMRERPYFDRISETYADPSIWRRDQHSMGGRGVGGSEARSIADLFEDQGVYMTPGNNQPSVDLAFRDMLDSVLWKSLRVPQLKIFSTCTNLLKELRLLRYREWATRQAQERSNAPEEIVGKQNHAWDALKYLLIATHAEAPSFGGYPANSWGRLMRTLVDMRQRRRLVLG